MNRRRKPERRSGGKAVATVRSKHAASRKAGLDPKNGENAAAREPAALTGSPAAIDWEANREIAAADDSYARRQPSSTVSATAAESLVASGTSGHSTASEERHPVFHMDSSLEIKDVEDVHRRLASTLTRGGPVTVDVRRLGAVDTAGVQLLVAFQSEAAKRGVSVEFCGESPSLTHALSVLGLETAIRLVSAHD